MGQSGYAVDQMISRKLTAYVRRSFAARVWAGPLVVSALTVLSACSTVMPPHARVEFPQPTNLIQPAGAASRAASGTTGVASGGVSSSSPASGSVEPTVMPSGLNGAGQNSVQATVGNRGAIFQSAQSRPLFEDHRARRVGDVITVVIRESISASQSSNAQNTRGGGVETGVSGLLGLPEKIRERMTLGAKGSVNNNGSGSTGVQNSFDSDITAVVTSVLPNGLLEITGEKQIGLNRNVETLRIFGHVDPNYIRFDRNLGGSAISSKLVANVRVEQIGQGPVGDSQARGWLSRVFAAWSPF